MKKMTCLFGRLLLSSVFISSAVNGLINPFAMELAIGINVPLGDDPTIGKSMLYLSIALQLVAGLMVLVGFKTKIAAWLLMVQLVAINVFVHIDFKDSHEILHFGQNLSIIGGLFLLITFGAGPLSIDGHQKKQLVELK